LPPLSVLFLPPPTCLFLLEIASPFNRSLTICSLSSVLWQPPKCADCKDADCKGDLSPVVYFATRLALGSCLSSWCSWSARTISGVRRVSFWVETSIGWSLFWCVWSPIGSWRESWWWRLLAISTPALAGSCSWSILPRIYIGRGIAVIRELMIVVATSVAAAVVVFNVWVRATRAWWTRHSVWRGMWRVAPNGKQF
jgi:hypothetical protein